MAGSSETGVLVVDGADVDGFETAGLAVVGVVASGVVVGGLEVGVGAFVFVVAGVVPTDLRSGAGGVCGVVVVPGPSVLRTCTCSVFGSGGGALSVPGIARSGIEPEVPVPPGMELL